MIEFSIYWPVLRDSNRMPHWPMLWESWENALVREFGGFSTMGESAGQWRDSDGHIVKDVSRVYRVAIRPNKETALYDLVRRYRPRFDQQCVYVAVTSENANLVE